MSSQTEEIKARIDIAELIGSYIAIQKAGRNFKAKCPFHHERTASFMISPERGSYYCFGCGVKGDVFTFVEEFEGVDFKGALHELAARAGVVLERENPREQEKKTRLYTLLEEATRFFELTLKHEKEAKAYLEKRGVKPETVKQWRLGFAPSGWHNISKHLEEKGFTQEEMLSVGLIKTAAEKKDRTYDTFRERVIFPLFDTSGRVIAFSGRSLVSHDTVPKYLNSPETVLFDKSEVLYGLHRAKHAIRKVNFSVLVEGQMDIVLSHQAGITNTVATSGTALSSAHMVRLNRLSQRLILAFDSDKAGISATRKSAALGLSLGMEVKAIYLPEDEDPADVITRDPKEWKKILRNSEDVIMFFLHRLLMNDSDKKTQLRNVRELLLPLVAQVESHIERAHFVGKISEKLHVPEEAVWHDLSKTSDQSVDTSVSSQKKDTNKTFAKPSSLPLSRREMIEEELRGLYFFEQTLRESVLDISWLEKELEKITENSTENFFKVSSDKKERLIFALEQRIKKEDDDFEKRLHKEAKELLLNLEEEVLRVKRDDISHKIKEEEKRKNQDAVEALIEEHHELSQKIARLYDYSDEEV